MTRRSVTADDYESLRAAACRVLDANRVVDGRSTLPAPGQYPHQWNWDSAFIAIGLAGVDAHRAIDELEALFAGQWANGMVPHIVYNADEAFDRTYFPQSWRWGIETAEPGTGPPVGVKTSGITQPPVAAIAAAQIARAHADEHVTAGLRRLYPKLLASHRFLLGERDPERTGLAFQVHPWESGLDDSPRWKGPVDAVVIDRARLPSYKRLDTSLVPANERPTAADYDCYVFLIEVYKEHAYSSSALFRHCPFLVQDVLFNALLHRANEALVEIAELIGETTEEIGRWMDRTRCAFSERLWDKCEGRYLDADLRSGRPVDQNTIATFVPLYAGLPSGDQAERLVRQHLTNVEEYWPASGRPHFVVPTVSKNSEHWEPSRYWRGPIWLNTNWLLIEGLQRYGFVEEAERVRDDTLSLLACPLPGGDDWWFCEYFNPTNGNAHGTVGFSWSAAVALALTEPSPPGPQASS